MKKLRFYYRCPRQPKTIREIDYNLIVQLITFLFSRQPKYIFSEGDDSLRGYPFCQTQRFFEKFQLLVEQLSSQPDKKKLFFVVN